jgi:hypothetical protein
VEDVFKNGKVYRDLNENADALLLIHEWGIRYRKFEKVRKFCNKYSIPLIEDCALIFNKDVGINSDYALYSLPKIFPMQYGGLLRKISKDEIPNKFKKYLVDKNKEMIIKKQLSYHLQDLRKNYNRRLKNWNYLNDIFIRNNIRPYFKIQKDDFPYIYMLKTDKSENLSRRLKKYGIEAGVYWKNDALFIPCHQNLRTSHLDYIAEAILGNIDKCNKNKQ